MGRVERNAIPGVNVTDTHEPALESERDTAIQVSLTTCFQLLGQKEVELFALRQTVVALKEELVKVSTER